MTTVKLTKTELRSRQHRLGQLQKYLPTLQLKKAMLQAEVNAAAMELKTLETHFDVSIEKVEIFAALLTDAHASILFESVVIKTLNIRRENVAGVDVPVLELLEFFPSTYSLFDTPIWMEAAIVEIKELITYREKIRMIKMRKEALEKELREVSIRVNLFEKIMIPRAKEHIRKIKVFLGDQELAAISQAKVAKEKILARKRAAVEMR